MHEQSLKEFYVPFIEILGLRYDPLIINDPRIIALLKSLAPPGQTTIQPDSHYFWSTVLMGNHVPMFQLDNQLKQWQSYAHEIYYLLHFIFLVHKLPDTTLLLSNPSSKGNIINKPYSLFISEPCSAKTFAAFINTANVIIPNLYLIALMCFEERIRPEIEA